VNDDSPTQEFDYHGRMPSHRRFIDFSPLVPCWPGIIFAALVYSWCAIAQGADIVDCKREGKTIHLSGKIVIQAQDGGILLLTPDGRLWTLPPDQIISKRHDDQPSLPLTGDELKHAVLAELPAGFESTSTNHYLICYNTSRGYAQWCGALFERLYLAFTNFWKNRGFKLHEPTMPLVVVIYADQQTYIHQSTDELGNNGNRVIGFYSLQTNRVKMFDLTGAESSRPGGEKRADAASINQVLSRPDAAMMVSTVIHEATHQITFNCGLQQRFADIPLWLCEGLAEYFETPDLSFGKGWRTIGEINRPRLAQFQEYLLRRPPDSLNTLLVNDKRFRNPNSALDAYAEAWALNYFLLRQHPKEFQNYLERMAQKGPLELDQPSERLQEFKASFGSDLAAFDNEFLRYMARVK
jgi:Protein of unknown function (DUF1570)